MERSRGGEESRPACARVLCLVAFLCRCPALIDGAAFARVCVWLGLPSLLTGLRIWVNV